MKFRVLRDKDFDIVFDLVKSCYTKYFYEITDESKPLYRKVTNSGYSIGAFDDNQLAGILLGYFSTDNNFGCLEEGIPEEFENLDMNTGFELMSSCVDKRYRGNHLEKKMVQYIIDNVPASWFWCMAHEDNIPSNKCIIDNGFLLVKRNCTFQYPHKTIYHRNLYFRIKS